MAQLGITKIVDGQRNAVFHVSFVGTGAGELTDEVLIDPATSFDPALPADPAMTIEKIWYDLTGFSAELEFDYLASDTPVWSMSESQPFCVDFCSFGGLKDRSNPDSGLGKLKITTTGLGDGDFGTLIVQVKKG